MLNRLFRRSEKPQPPEDDGAFDTSALVAERPRGAEPQAPVAAGLVPPPQPAQLSDAPTTESMKKKPPADDNKGATTPVAPPDSANGDPLLHLALKPKIVDAICTVFDPEIPVNIYELGLIYGVEIDAENVVHVDMTLTSPACPSAQQLPAEVAYKIKAIEGVKDVNVNIVWEPPWSMDKMSEAARMHLGMF
jgi:FeS assembly SUF system protein